MTSWSQLIEKIQRLLCAYEEDLADSRGLLSSQPTVLLSEQTIAGPVLPSDVLTSPGSALSTANVSIAGPSFQLFSQQQNCHDAGMRETVNSRICQQKSSSRVTVPAEVEKMPLQFQSRKRNPCHRLQKKYKYVNKKFIVCKETRKGERDSELIDREASGVNDPFEFVGTQSMSGSAAVVEDQRTSAGQLTVYGELSEVQQPVKAHHRRRRQQQRQNEKALKQLAEDIDSAESYSLVISQHCLARPHDDEQMTDTTLTERDTTAHVVTVTEVLPAAYTDANEICYDETGAGMETDADSVCMPGRQSAGHDFVNNEHTDENEEIELEHGVMSRAISDADVNVKTEQQLCSAPVSDKCSATVGTETLETCLRSSGNRCDSELQMATIPLAGDLVSISSGGELHAVVSTSPDVSVSQCALITGRDTKHGVSPSEIMTVVSSSPEKTAQHDTCDISYPAVAANGEHNSPVMFVGGSGGVVVKRSCKRRRKAWQSKAKSERIHYDNSTLLKLQRKAASLIDSDVEDNSSGQFVFVIV